MYRNYTSAQIEVNGEIVEAAKLLDREDFLYTKVTVERPLRLVFNKMGDKLLDAIENKVFPKKEIPFFANVAAVKGINERRSDADFFAFLLSALKVKKIQKGYIKKLRYYADIDENAPEVYDIPGDTTSPCVPDPALRDTENIPFKTDIDTYFTEEVLRFVPDAWMDRNKDKIGCEFPFSKLFYVYKPLRERSAILEELFALDRELENELNELKNED